LQKQQIRQEIGLAGDHGEPARAPAPCPVPPLMSRPPPAEPDVNQLRDLSV
jgi:hypothetical protein